MLVPEGCTPEQGDALTGPSSDENTESESDSAAPIRVLDRVLWSITDETTIDTESGRCVVRPASGLASEAEYRLRGERFYGFESPWPLFRGRPTLRVAKAEQAARAAPSNETEWRQGRGDWSRNPEGFGLWDVRHVRDGELRHVSRLGILPARFGLSIEPGSDMSQGHLVLTGCDGVRAAGHDPDVVVMMQTRKGDVLRIQVAATDPVEPPVHIRLRLHWPGATELIVKAPFPGQGGRFRRNGRPLSGELTVDDLYGVRATALSPSSAQQFRIEGELRAEGLGELVRVAHFRRPLLKSGVFHEMPLIDLRSRIEQLLSASSSDDARVVLRILDRSRNCHDTVQVSRFAATLEREPHMMLASVSPPVADDTAPTFEAMPLARPSDEPIALYPIGPAHEPIGAVLPHDLNANEPWLLVMRHGGQVRVGPVRIDSSCELGTWSGPDAAAPRLAEALSIADVELRAEAVAAAMDSLLTSEDSKYAEAEWSFLTDSLLQAEGLPASTLDLLKVLVTKPDLLVRCLFNLDSAPRQRLWRLEEELPFSWLLVPRACWWREAKRAFDHIREQLTRLAGMIDGDPDPIAREHVEKILAEGADRLPALCTVSTDVPMRLMGDRPSRYFREHLLEERAKQITEQIRLRASQDDWPSGDGRRIWAQELTQGAALHKFIVSQHPDQHPVRQPLFDTPIAAAWCCFCPEPTERTVFLVKHIRAHDPEWFDVAYSAAWFQLARMQDALRRST